MQSRGRLLGTSKLIGNFYFPIRHQPRIFSSIMRKSSSQQQDKTNTQEISKDKLMEWAKREWGDTTYPACTHDKSEQRSPHREHYIDLFSAKISQQCVKALQSHQYPSSAVAEAMFSSWVFLPEKLLLSSLLPSSVNRKLPETVFTTENDGNEDSSASSFFCFYVAKITKQEVIFKWPTRNMETGCTMLGVDIQKQTIYLGSGIRSSLMLSGFIFQYIAIPFHSLYSKILLYGAVQQLERKARKADDTRKVP